MATELSLAGDQSVPLSLSATDDIGNPIVDGLSGLTGIAWSEDSGGAILALTPAADGLSAQITAVGPPGITTVSVSAVRPDGSTIVGSCTITVTAGAVAALDIVPGEAVHK
jgi:hypothetical protein